MTQYSRILLVRLRSLGDAVLMTPALAVAKQHPSTRLAVLVEEPFHQILEGNPQVDQIIPVPRCKSPLMGKMLAIQAARRFSPDLTIDLHGGTTSALITALSGAPCRVGYSSSRSRFLYNQCIPDSRQIWVKDEIHTVEHQLSPFKHLGFKVDPIPSLHISIQPDSLRQVRLALCQKGVEGDFILIHPGAAFDTKQWGSASFRDLAGQLAAAGWSVVFTSGPGEERILARLRQNSSESIHFMDPLPLAQFAALTSLCRLYVGNDTGTTHIAAALRKPLVVIFGSSDSSVWYPWGTRFRLIKSDLPCIPCPGYYCLHYDKPLCIQSITVPSVLEAVSSLLCEGNTPP